MRKYALVLIAFVFTMHTSWAAPIFSVTPNVTGQPELVKGQQGTYLFQITNNTNNNLANIGLHNLPAGTSAVASTTASLSCTTAPSSCQYCTFPLTLAAQASCLLKLTINSNLIDSSIQGGPQVCFTANKPVYCSQPFQISQLSTNVRPGPISTLCDDHISNFNSELSQSIDSSTIDNATIYSWGPARNQLIMSSSNPNTAACMTTNLSNSPSLRWMEKRVIEAEKFWVSQKLNYCHHHVPDFQTPATSYGTPRASISTGGGFCSNVADLMPGSTYYGQNVRWNYSGSNAETSANWNNNNYMWYGVDCSDFTAFIYNYAFGIQFNSDTGYQGGQCIPSKNCPGGVTEQDKLTPNSQTISNNLVAFTANDPDSSAGVLLCSDGSLDVTGSNPNCGAYGTNRYISVFDKDGNNTLAVTDKEIAYFQPGDLIFLGFKNQPAGGDDPVRAASLVTHVITWTGKKVGYGVDDIHPSKIAPESVCPQSDWQPQVGDWVIIDSHYQGADYRVFSACFYKNNIWGVRRVIGYMQP